MGVEFDPDCTDRNPPFSSRVPVREAESDRCLGKLLWR